MVHRGRRRLFLAFVAVAASCAPPLQNGGVVMQEGAASRLEMVCRWRHGQVEGDPCGLAADRPAPARVRRIAADADKLSGPLSAGRGGDFLLENDEIAVVIEQLGRGSGFAESGGNIVDAADARTRHDEIGQVFTYFGVFPRQAIYEALESGVDDKGTAWIEARGHELHEPELKVVTRYELLPGARALVISTAVVNKKSAPIEGLDLGDAVQWGSAEKFGPKTELGFTGEITAPWIGGAGRHVSYALLGAAADDVLFAKSGSAGSNISFARGVSLAPGKSAQIRRLLVVGPRGDSLSVATELFVLGGGAPGGLEVELVDAKGARVAPPEGGRILLGSAPLPASVAPLWMRVSREMVASGGNAAAELAPGRYAVGFEGAGRVSTTEVSVSVEPGKVAKIRLPVSAAGAVRATLRERDAGALRKSPGKVQLFDAASNKRVGAPVLAPEGAIEIPASPGRYRVVASRGPEFSLAEQVVEVLGGKTAAVELTLDRVVDTRGFIGCDLHQHSARSFDAGVSMQERAASNAAEGVECAVVSEHNNVVDMGPIVDKMGLSPYLRAIIGNELTSDASREPFGHVNVFPLAVDPADSRGGAIPVRDRTAREVFDAVLAVPGEKVIQVNHPRLGQMGYFEKLRFDPATGVGAAPGYDQRFDAVEVWSGRHVESRPKLLADLWALLRTSHPVTPTANTDTHGIINQEAGYPRTYVRVADDDPARLDAGSLVEGIRKKRDVVLTNGPFVTMRIGAVEQGGLASMGEITVHVERAPWVDVSELVIWVGGVPGEPIPLAGKTSPSGSLVDDVTIHLAKRPKPSTGKPSKPSKPSSKPRTIEVAEDTFLVATVLGKRPLEPVLMGDSAEIQPFAMTAPLWLDVDGDGRSLGR